MVGRISWSSVGTTTEVLDHLRLLFEKLGQAYCPTYGHALKSQSPSEVYDEIIKTHEGQRFYVLAPIQMKGRQTQRKKLVRALLQEGFYRVYLPPKSSKKALAQVNSFPPCRPAPKIAGGKFLVLDA